MIRCAFRPRGGASPGFTLVEVMIALMVIGVVLLGARAILGQLADDADRIAAAAVAADRDANGEALLRTIVGRLDVGPGADGATPFRGELRGARFHSWCEVPAGWLERCAASLGFITLDDGPVLALRLSTGEMVQLRRGFQNGEIAYLRKADAGGEWVGRWGASITAPVALCIVIDGDTTILRIGERG